MNAHFNPVYARYLVRAGLVKAHEALLAMEMQQARRPLLGHLAKNERMLSAGQVEQIVEAQRAVQRRFGDLAVELNFLTPTQVLSLLQLQEDETPTLNEVLIERGYDRGQLERTLQQFLERNQAKQAAGDELKLH